MFDIGGPELILVAIIAIIIIGPKELPAAIRTVTAVIRKARGLASDFRSGLDEMVRESELNEVKEDIEKSLDLDEFENSIGGDIKEALDPDEDFDGAFDYEGDWYGPDEEDGTSADSTDDAAGTPETETVALDEETATTGTPDENPTAEGPDLDDAERKPRADAAS